MNILDRVRKIPGGLLLVPMLITAVINTFWPQLLLRGGAPNPTMAIASSAGTMTTIGMLLFVSGTQLRVHQIGMAFARGGVLVLVRLLLGFAASWFVLSKFGPNGFWGISALALVVAMSSCNPGVYMGLMQNYGDNVDKAAMGVLNIIAVPAIPLLILDISNGRFDYMVAVSTFMPFLIGMILGNLDSKIPAMFAPTSPVILVFMGLCFGSVLNLRAAVAAGGSGVVLAAIFLVVGLPFMIAADKLILKRPGYASVAISCVGGVSISSPSIIARALPEYAPYVEAATAQVALAVIISSIVIPILTKYMATKYGSGAAEAK